MPSTAKSSALVEPRSATDEEILGIHDFEYVEAVKSFSRGETKYDPARFNFNVGGDNPIFENMFEAAALSTGASLVAAEIAGDGKADVAFNISGGSPPRGCQARLRVLRVQRPGHSHQPFPQRGPQGSFTST